MSLILTVNAILIVITLAIFIVDKLFGTYGNYKITINNSKDLEVEGGNTLLSLLNERNIFVPSACGGKATCGLCKVRILSGAGKLLPTEEGFISHSERVSGMRLACQVKVKNDIELMLPEYVFNAKEYRAKVTKVETLTHDIKFIRFEMSGTDDVEFKPGQYIQIKIPGTEEFRAYSIASSPDDSKYVELIVRLIPGGLCSTYLHKVLKKGDKVSLVGPFGEFFLQEQTKSDIVAIAGGSGMAPIMSIIKYLAKREMPRKLTYFFGARTTNDLYYLEYMDEIMKKFENFKFVPVLSEPKVSDSWKGHTGFVTKSVEHLIENASDMEAYLCGPPPMIDAAVAVLNKKGMDTGRIYYDKF